MSITEAEARPGQALAGDLGIRCGKYFPATPSPCGQPLTGGRESNKVAPGTAVSRSIQVRCVPLIDWQSKDMSPLLLNNPHLSGKVLAYLVGLLLIDTAKLRYPNWKRVQFDITRRCETVDPNKRP
ncbi:Uncharacterized protein HZ326_14524 [Fusarium oxysporum f. sp. albedinis]|nr:Uncharacterized protein HZ326_14524 [Fusarium oxysporum f. sp. albedinis]